MKEMKKNWFPVIAWYGTFDSYHLTQPWLKSQPTLQGLNIHLSTQASATNVEITSIGSNSDPCCFWHVRLLWRSGEIRKLVRTRNWRPCPWCYVYLILGSLYPFSNHMSDRDANRGGCSRHAVSDLYDMPFGPRSRKIPRWSSWDTQCQPLRHVWLKISQTLSIMALTALKSKVVWNLSHYESTVANCYKLLVTLTWKVQKRHCMHQEDDLMNELWRELPNVNWQRVSTRHQQKTEQLFDLPVVLPQYKLVVVDFDPATMTATIRQRNVILEGDHVEHGPRECDIKDFTMLMITKLTVHQTQWSSWYRATRS